MTNDRGLFGGPNLLKIFPRYFDWTLFLAIIPLIFAGLITMNSFEASNQFFSKQLIWASIALPLIVGLSYFDFRFLRRTNVLVGVYLVVVFLLVTLMFIGSIFQGAKSWFDFGFAAFQPADLSKVVLILVLAKYFSRRHIEIANIKHILISGFYSFVLFALVFFQPDFGSAIIIFFIWLGMVLVAGISKKHLVLVFGLATLVFSALWFFGFADYQKQRIMTFLNPLTDIHGAGYNAYQSTIAVGSGQIIGKGIGFGTQSKLQFLPEYQTDFIFAAFAEEWGFIGVVLLFFFFGVLIWRIIEHARQAESNFEALFAVGVAVYFLTHFTIHVGINVGLLPVTGTTIPFLSYGGSHLLVECTAIGILMGMRKYSRAIHKQDLNKEFVGV